jgi:hypothetical protein
MTSRSGLKPLPFSAIIYIQRDAELLLRGIGEGDIAGHELEDGVEEEAEARSP